MNDAVTGKVGPGTQVTGNPTYREVAAWPIALVHLDILLEAVYLHLVCLPKNNANALSCCKAPWTC
jgi:hypothetical protein